MSDTRQVDNFHITLLIVIAGTMLMWAFVAYGCGYNEGRLLELNKKPAPAAETQR